MSIEIEKVNVREMTQKETDDHIHKNMQDEKWASLSDEVVKILTGKGYNVYFKRDGTGTEFTKSPHLVTIDNFFRYVEIFSAIQYGKNYQYRYYGNDKAYIDKKPNIQRWSDGRKQYMTNFAGLRSEILNHLAQI